MNCVLCESSEVSLGQPYKDGQAYLHCGRCDLRYLQPSLRLQGADERSRYTLHQTATDDVGYRQFVGPLVTRLREMAPPPAQGLDFGAGHQPVLAEHLRALGYTVALYDPFFWPAPEALQTIYDFVISCEVVEHFFDPAAEFARLRRLVRPGGALVINTEIYSDAINFETWYYRRDPTHVVFYSARTFEWIGRHFGFAHVSVAGRVASLS